MLSDASGRNRIRIEGSLMMLGDQHSAARLEEDRLWHERSGEYSGGIQRVKGPAMSTDPKVIEAEKRFSESIRQVWQRPPLAKCSCCQKKFYDHSAIESAEAEGCPGCGRMSTLEDVH
jgi:hypothetical protein